VAACSASQIDPVCELHEPLTPVPWGRYEARPLIVMPAWRFDVLSHKAMQADELTKRRDEDRRKAEKHLASVVAAGIAREARIRSDLDACAESRGGTWATWEVALVVVGVGIGAGAVGAIVGYAAAGR
jgi:hypothetical protein